VWEHKTTYSFAAIADGLFQGMGAKLAERNNEEEEQLSVISASLRW
jgi:hypothetical protein